MPKQARHTMPLSSPEDLAPAGVPLIDQMYGWTESEEANFIEALYNETADIADEDIYFLEDVVRSKEEYLGESNFIEYLYGMGVRHRFKISAAFIGRTPVTGRRRRQSPLDREILYLVQDITAICERELTGDQSLQLVRLIRRQLQANIKEVTAVRLPEVAPELYKDRPIDPSTGKREEIDVFLARVWLNPWIKAGVLTRTDFRRLDPQGEVRLANWLLNNMLPKHLYIPTKSESVEAVDKATAREGWRLGQRFLRQQRTPRR